MTSVRPGEGHPKRRHGTAQNPVRLEGSHFEIDVLWRGRDGNIASRNQVGHARVGHGGRVMFHGKASLLATAGGCETLPPPSKRNSVIPKSDTRDKSAFAYFNTLVICDS